MNRAYEFAYVTGEASGDRHAAELHRQLIAAFGTEAHCIGWGIGGSDLRIAGIEIIQDSSTWGAIGIVESLKGIPDYLRGFAAIKKRLLKQKPDGLILVDFGAFNVTLAKWAKKNNIGPIIYYLPPGSWKAKGNLKQNQNLASLCDLIITPFEWSEKNLRAAGANAHWVGHPLLDVAKPTITQTQFAEKFGLDAQHPMIALLPGSRSFEVKYNLPMMLDAAEIISRRIPGSQFLLAAASSLKRQGFEQMLHERRDHRGNRAFNLLNTASNTLKKIADTAVERATPVPQYVTSEGVGVRASDHENRKSWHELKTTSDPNTPAPVAIIENLAYDCLSSADFAIIASGTATLEAAILKCPMVIVYKASKLMEMEWNLRRKRLAIEYIGLPNIIAKERIVQELLQDDASADAVAEIAVSFFVEPEQLIRYKQIISERVLPSLGKPGVVKRAAQLIKNYVYEHI